ncbi:MAG: hypothetical protein KDB01_27480, partial [Planctomycetaceae bacterium]|nr:hypothetical protein [Planctomycetaceae bacterium]
MSTRKIRDIMLSSRVALFIVAGCLATDVCAQPVKSPEVHADGRVTLRLRAAKASEVDVSLDGKKVTMVKNADGVWEGTSEP